VARQLTVGLDVGTTTVKAAVFDLADASAPIVVARRPSATRAPRHGWSEVEPMAVMGLVREVLREAVSQVDAGDVRTLGISGTACGAWLADDDLRPVRPAILWNDGRAVDVVQRWADEGTTEEIFRISGNVPYPGYTLPVLRWLAAHEPANLERATHVLCAKDWMRAQLTGVVTFEESDASYVPFGLRERDWSSALFDVCGVAEEARLLPPLDDPRRTDPILAVVAAEVGLHAGVQVALGATDIIAGCVGSGAISPGYASTILGTSDNSSLISAEPLFEPDQTGINAAAPLGNYARTMVNTSGSATLDWTARLLCGGDVTRLLELAGQADSPSTRPVLLPYLANTGVVSPFADPGARAVLAGLRIDDGPAEVARAAVEGLAFAVADCYESMPREVVELTAIGGAARSGLLLQAIADATDAAVIRPAGEEFGARGVGLLAAWASGDIDDTGLVETSRALQVDHRFEPDRARVAEALERYRRTSDVTRTLWRNW
jgi:xylulokinase/erythritol kinase